MKAIDLRQKPKEELEGILLEERKKAEELRFVAGRTKVKNVKALRQIKKDIARVETLLTEKASQK
jgi:large subunit ribosomal protein L29